MNSDRLQDGDIVQLDSGRVVQLTAFLNGSWFCRPCDPGTLRRDDSGQPEPLRERVRGRLRSALVSGGSRAGGGDYDPLRRAG